MLKSASMLVCALVAIAEVPLSATAGSRPCSASNTRVVGGERARLRDWPGLAAIRRASIDGLTAQYFCGGTAIDRHWVLTAAHCLADFADGLETEVVTAQGTSVPARLEVVLGTDDLTAVSEHNTFPVDRVVIHDDYLARIRGAMKPGSRPGAKGTTATISYHTGNDVALLRLARPWEGPLAMLALEDGALLRSASGVQVRVAGFGKTSRLPDVYGEKQYRHRNGVGVFWAGTDVLRQASMLTADLAICRARYKHVTMLDGWLCAGIEQGGDDACQGDSGGPLVAYDGACPYQVGIVSWGSRECGEPRAFGVYTRVSAHAAWLQRHVATLSVSAPVAPPTGALTASQLEGAINQLRSILGPASGGLSLRMRGGNRIQVGSDVQFELQSSMSGRLLMLDINPEREVTLLFPNKYLVQEGGDVLRAGTAIIPGAGHGFTSYRAGRPTGPHLVMVMLLPTEFDLSEAALAAPALDSAGQAIREPISYLMRLIGQIENGARRLRTDQGTRHWEFATLSYEIVE